MNVFHSIHNNGQKKRFLSIANQFQLMVTGACDFHVSGNYDNKNFGVYGIGEQYLSELKKNDIDLNVGQASIF